jgi:hypothetical protein
LRGPPNPSYPDSRTAWRALADFFQDAMQT